MCASSAVAALARILATSLLLFNLATNWYIAIIYLLLLLLTLHRDYAFPSFLDKGWLILNIKLHLFMLKLQVFFIWRLWYSKTEITSCLCSETSYLFLSLFISCFLSGIGVQISNCVQSWGLAKFLIQTRLLVENNNINNNCRSKGTLIWFMEGEALVWWVWSPKLFMMVAATCWGKPLSFSLIIYIF